MKTISAAPAGALSPLFLAWLGLVALTVFGLCLGRWLAGEAWLQVAVAGVVWLKGWIVARYFLESHRAHPFVAWVVRGFLVCVPAALVFTALFGKHLARWTTL